MRDLERREIDGVNYVCEMMPATVAHKTLIEACDMLGHPTISAIATGFGDTGLGVGVDEVINVAARMLFEKVSPESADKICKSLLNGVQAEGVGYVNQDKIFDGHFRGKILHMYRVVAWSIEVNYSDFFDAARSSPSFAKALERAGEVFQLLTATLQSGDSSATETEP